MMVPDNIINDIFEQSVVDALSKYGIDVPLHSGETFSKYNQRGIFLRETVLNKLINEYNYNPSFGARIVTSYDPVTRILTYDQDYLNSIVADYVKNHIVLETGRMQIDAERKILENLIEGDYFKKGGAKKLVENVSEVISPGSSKFTKFLGAKPTKGNENSYRKAVLDYLMPGTDTSLESALEKVEKFRGKDDRPAESPPTGPVTPIKKAGQSFQKAVLDVLESKAKNKDISSPYMSNSLSIKESYETATKPFRDQIKELRKEVGGASLRGDTARVAAINSQIDTALDEIHLITYGSARVPGAPSVAVPGSFAYRLIQESSDLKTRLVDTIPAGRRPMGTISPRTDFLFFGGGYGTVAHDVWEINPDARLKVIEYKTKRDALLRIVPAGSPPTALQKYYEDLIAKYEKKLKGSLGDTREALSFKFTELGELELTDRLQARYNRAITNLSKGLYKLDVPAELNKFRLESLQVNGSHILELKSRYEAMIASGITLTPDQLALFNNATLLAKRFEVHAQALSVLEGMRFVKPGEMLAFGKMKREFINNIAEFESDPARQAQMIDAIRTNNYRAFRALVTSGSGNTSTDRKITNLYTEFQTFADSAGNLGHKDFLLWANKVSIDHEIIRGFIMRRHVENAVYAVQLMTNPDYLKSEIKVHFQREVVRRVGNVVQDFTQHYLSTNIPALSDNIDSIISFIGDPDFYKDPKKFLKAKGKDELKKNLKKWVTKQEFYKKYAVQNLFGLEVELDIVEFIFSPKKFIFGLFKDIIWTNINKVLNDTFRRTVERLAFRYRALKRLFWRYLEKFKNTSLRFAQRMLTTYFGRFGSWAAMRLAGIMAGLTVPVAGWIVTAVLVVLPIILRPIFGDKDLGQMFKDFIKFLLLGPCLLVLFIYLIIIVPIISLFANFWDSLWNSVTGGGSKTYFDDDKFNEALLSDRVFGGLEGSLGSYNLGTDMISGLVNTSGNKCVDSNYRPLLAEGANQNWNNLKPADFQNITGPTFLNCRIMCNVQRIAATLYPGIKSDSGQPLINCSATDIGQTRFNPALAYGDEKQRYWCTYTVMDAYVDDFSDISSSDNASVRQLDTWFKNKVAANQGIMRIGNEQCFDPDELMSGAAIIMTTSSCSTLSSGNHAAVFLKIENGKFVYINSNSGVIKETVDVESCSGGKVRISPRYYYQGTPDEIKFEFCSFYQIDRNSYNPLGKTCPTDCIPDKNNY